MDEDLFVRRASPGFVQLAATPPEELVGQPLFLVLERLGVLAPAMDQVFEFASHGRACFVELPAGSLGGSRKHFAVEIRPVPVQSGWVIRYVAVAWTRSGLRSAQGTSAWIPAPARLAAPVLAFPAAPRFAPACRRGRSGATGDRPAA